MSVPEVETERIATWLDSVAAAIDAPSSSSSLPPSTPERAALHCVPLSFNWWSEAYPSVPDSVADAETDTAAVSDAVDERVSDPVPLFDASEEPERERLRPPVLLNGGVAELV